MADGTIEERLGDTTYTYVTTTGRKTGQAREIEIWFAARGNTIYMSNAAREDKRAGAAGWVYNLRALPQATVRIGDEQFNATARLIVGTEEERVARDRLYEKYQPTVERDLTTWRETGYPIALDLVPAEG